MILYYVFSIICIHIIKGILFYILYACGVAFVFPWLACIRVGTENLLASSSHTFEVACTFAYIANTTRSMIKVKKQEGLDGKKVWYLYDGAI